MIRQEKFQERPTQGGREWWWIALPLALVGYFACVQLFSFALRFHNSGLVVILGAVLGPPLLLALALALRQGLAYVRSFAPTLRWWHLLWALMVVSAMVFRQRTAADISSDPLDAWAVFRVAVDIVVAAVLLGRLALRRTHWLGSMFRGVVGALSIYGVVCLISTTWSVFPTWTLFKSLEYLGDIAVLAAVLQTLDSVEGYRNFFNWTWALYGALLLCVGKDLILWPKEALYTEFVESGATLGMRLSGLFPAISSNDVSTFSSTLGLLSLARLFPASTEERFHKPWYALLLLTSLAFMVLAQTRAAFVGFMLGGICILLFSKRGKFGAFFIFILTPIVVLSTMGGLIWSFMQRGQSAHELGTFSSRANWWALAWNTYLQQPLTGFGAYAAGRFAVLAKAGQATTGTMHSDYLEVIVGTGMWGLIPLLVALAATWWLIVKYVRHPANPQEAQLAHESLAILTLLTFRSIFNNNMTWHPALPFLAILGFAEFLRRRRQARARVEYRSRYLGDLVTTQGESAAVAAPDWEN